MRRKKKKFLFFFIFSLPSTSDVSAERGDNLCR